MYVVVACGVIIVLSLYAIMREDVQEALRKRREPILRLFRARKRAAKDRKPPG